MKFIAVLLLLQSSVVFAEKKISAKDFSTLGKIDESNMIQVESTKSAPVPVSNNSSFTMSCRDSSGKDFKQGEVGYDSCLAGIKSQHDMNKMNPALKGKNNGSTNGASFNYKIGN